MIGGIDATTRSKARAAIHAPAAQRRRRSRCRVRAGRCSGGARAASPSAPSLSPFSRSSATVGGLALLLAWGPINLECLNPRIASSLQERLGPRYVVSIGPTSLMRGDGGVALGFGGIAIRDSAGRPVLSAPGGRVGLDVWSLLTLEIKVHRLELDGLDLRLQRAARRRAVDRRRRRRRRGDDRPSGADPARRRVDGGAGFRTGRDRPDRRDDRRQPVARPRQRSSTATSKCSTRRSASARSTTISSCRSPRSGEAASISVGAKGPQGRWSVEAQARGGPERMVSLTAHDLDFDDMRLFNANRPPFEADMPISLRLEAKLGANSAIETMQGRFTLGRRLFQARQPRSRAVLHRRGDRRRRLGSRRRAAIVSTICNCCRARPISTRPVGRRRRRARSRPGSAISSPATRCSRRSARARSRSRSNRRRSTPTFTPGRGGWCSTVWRCAARPSTARRAPKRRRFPAAPPSRSNLQVGPSAVVDLLRLWPSFINADARAWCIQNIHGGQLLSASMKVDWDAAAFDLAAHKQAVPADSVLGEMTARDVVVDLMPGLPPLDGRRRQRAHHRPRVLGQRQDRRGRAVADPARSGLRHRLSGSRHLAGGGRAGEGERPSAGRRRRARRSARPRRAQALRRLHPRSRSGQRTIRGRSRDRPQARQERAAGGSAVPRQRDARQSARRPVPRQRATGAGRAVGRRPPGRH